TSEGDALRLALPDWPFGEVAGRIVGVRERGAERDVLSVQFDSFLDEDAFADYVARRGLRPVEGGASAPAIDERPEIKTPPPAAPIGDEDDGVELF
ncbi:MAG TPA: hypothetical protein PKZ99_12180, partial [Azospirillaceae bacterium]|nr:hypothetical protein [Azospirillaceae bacterium]